VILRNAELAKKEIGLIIQFDDKEYTDEERNLLWGRLFTFLAEAALEQKQEQRRSNVKSVKISR